MAPLQTEPQSAPRKLIEVALPLAAINREASREKSLRHGHPSTVHLWWSRKPTAACRAVLFAALVDDPGDRLPEPAAARERHRLFALIERLVRWENAQDPRLLAEARAEIAKHTGGAPPAVLDPFCGGGSIPLEAQRLGLPAYASDLNPVAVLTTKALIEIPPRFAGRAPVHPAAQHATTRAGWAGAAGLAADIQAYGAWMREQAWERIGHHYTPGSNGETVIAWIWARTVRGPNPACGIEMPLTSKFQLSTRPGHAAWVEPVVDRIAKTVRFTVHTGNPPNPSRSQAGTKGAKRGANFRCVACGTLVEETYLKGEGRAGRMGSQMFATVTEGNRGRSYWDPSSVPALPTLEAPWLAVELADDPRNIWCKGYGLITFRDLFTPRQLLALTTFSDLVAAAQERVRADAVAAGWPDDGVPLHQGGRGATAYADAVATYLGLAVSKASDYWSALCSWHSSGEKMSHTFARQALPMVWDFAEANPFSDATGNWMAHVAWVAAAVAAVPAEGAGQARLADATDPEAAPQGPGLIIATDPPYYDNIGYADLADFFYVWLRRALQPVWPDLFRTVLTPKGGELIVNPYRFGGDRTASERHFLDGMRQAFRLLRERTHPAYPAAIFYAFKQTEAAEAAEDGAHGLDGAAVSRGWEAMLTALIEAGFQVTATWPLRTEMGNRSVAQGTNALASSIVLVCRPRPADAPAVARQTFLAALRRELPPALDRLVASGIAAVDLQQAAIGPGMAVFSRYAQVLDTRGRPLPVREALALISRELDAYLAQEQGQLDPVSRVCLAWFEQHGFEAGPYGEMDVLLRARNTGEEALRAAEVAMVAGGRVQLSPLHRGAAETEWPRGGRDRATAWAAALRLAAAVQGPEGAADAAPIYARLSAECAEAARVLAYRLYAVCERRGWLEDAQRFSDLVAAWPLIQEAASRLAPRQGEFGF